MQEKLSKILSAPRVPQSFLVTGEDAAARDSFARALARGLLCDGESPPCGACRGCTLQNHPDLIDFLPEEKLPPVKEFRRQLKNAHVLPSEGARKVYLLSNAARMNIETQNALLAVLETPPKHVCFVLSSCHTSDLLPTVVSRCVEIKCGGEANTDLQLDYACELLHALHAHDELGVFSACMKMESLTRDELAPVLEGVRTLLRDGTVKILAPITDQPVPNFTYLEFIACAEALRIAEDGIRRNLGVPILLSALAVRLVQAVSE